MWRFVPTSLQAITVKQWFHLFSHKLSSCWGLVCLDGLFRFVLVSLRFPDFKRTKSVTVSFFSTGKMMLVLKDCDWFHQDKLQSASYGKQKRKRIKSYQPCLCLARCVFFNVTALIRVWKVGANCMWVIINFWKRASQTQAILVWPVFV